MKAEAVGMFLYLMQHGEALLEEHAPGRPLSLNGLEQVKVVARKARHAEVHMTAIYHSDKIRSHKTAQILGEELDVDIFFREGLGAKDEVAPVAEWVASLEEDVAIVGHLPFLDRLLGLLTVGDTAKGSVAFQFGLMVRLARSASGWKVDWLIRPDF